MPRFALLRLALIGFVAMLLSAAPEAKQEPALKGFTAHEWGVFTVSPDLATMNADHRAELDALPKFMYGQTTTRELPRHFIPTRVRKPVVFFHAPQPVAVEMRVQFPGGVPAVWWPATESPSLTDNGLGQPPKNEAVAKELFWRLYMQKAPDQFRKVSPLKEVGTGHWIKALRDVKCDEVFVEVGQRALEMEREKFVYYDGLIPRGKGVAIKVEDARVHLTNEAKYPLLDVTIVDRRTAKPRVASVAKLDGSAVQDVELKDAADARWPEKASQTLREQLKDAGLNEDEAQSLVVVWTREFFAADGVTLFYRIPQEEYDRLLPLTLKPRPEKLVRVGLLHHAHCEPGVAERVAKLVKQLNDDEFDKREAAQKELEKIGRAVYPHLVKLRPNITSPEAKRRVDELLEKHDVERTIKK